MAVSTKKSSMKTAPNGNMPAIKTLQLKENYESNVMRLILILVALPFFLNCGIDILTKVANSCTNVASEPAAVSYLYGLDADTDVCDSRNNSPSKQVERIFQTTSITRKSLY